jgi:DNA invertase Pin-like site-specific DNA recombinase
LDEAESATTDNRPEFQDMIRQCRDNSQGVDCVLVWKLSRFARNRIDSVVYKKLLSKQGIRVISVSEPIEDSPEGRILEGMIELIDSY